MNFDKKLFEQVCRSYVLEGINTSKYLRRHLPLLEHAKIYDWTKNKASYDQVVSLVIPEDSKPVTKEEVKEFENFVSVLVELKPGHRWPWTGAKVGAGKTVDVLTKERYPGRALKKAAIAVAIILAARYLIKKLTDPCIRNCRGNAECIKNCKASAIKKAISNLQSQMVNCKDTPNPAKCEGKIKVEIGKLQEKLRKLA